jgi:hypothetical protein
VLYVGSMSTDRSQLLAALSRTRPVTYNVAGDGNADCRDAVVLRHWTEPIEILVVRPDSAPFITFSKHVNNQLIIRVTTPVELHGSRLHVPDAVLCWATLDRFATTTAGAEPGHLIVRNGKIFSQRRSRGSDARIGGSDARTSRARTRARAHAPAPAPARSPVRAYTRTRTRTRTHACTQVHARDRAALRARLRPRRFRLAREVLAIVADVLRLRSRGD